MDLLNLMFPISYQNVMNINYYYNVINIGLPLYKNNIYEINLHQIHYGTQELQHH